MVADPISISFGLTGDGKAVLAKPQAQNAYAYANGNPIGNKDPDGRVVLEGILALLFVPNVAHAPSSDINLSSMQSEYPQVIFGMGTAAVRGGGASSGGVYQGIDSAGAVRYVGITERTPAIRFAEHANSGTARANLQYETIPGTGALPNMQKRLYEQSLLNQYGLQKNGGQLLNKINSISPSSPMYGSVQSFNPGTVSNSTPMTSAMIFPGMPNFRGTYDFGSGGVYNFSSGSAQKVK